MAQTQEQTTGTLDPSRTAGYQLRKPPSNLPDKHPHKT
jgi:hypothetical protein